MQFWLSGGMGNSRIKHLLVIAILGTYVVPCMLSSRSLLGQPLFFKLDPSFSVHNDRNIDIDERPYWTSHRHLTSSEHFSNDQVLNAAVLWTSIVDPQCFCEMPAVFIPTPVIIFPPNYLRAPPVSLSLDR